MWLTDESFIITSAHEPLSFLRRSGRDNIRADENYARLHTEETVLKLKKLGLTLFRFHFHKGCGYEMEREDRERTKEFIALCHKHELKVQIYIQFGTLMPETYRVEEPGYDDWIMRDENGSPITLLYSHQNFRNHPCPNRPGYWEHLKKIIKEGVADCGADAVGFDNVSWAEEPDVCHCDECKKAFARYLADKYPTQAAAKARFGHGSLGYITPPVWNYYNNHFNLTEIRQPVMQDWNDFRVLSLKKRVDEMYAECKKYNPDVVVEINAFRQTGQNSTFVSGLYETDLASGCDAFWSEMEPDPGYADGLLHHKVRAYKACRAMGKLLFTGHGEYDRGSGRSAHLLAMSESMVYQYGSVNCLRMLNNFLPADDGDAPHLPLKKFADDNRSVYMAEPVSFAHVYESRASLSNSNFESHYANILMQQVLLREKIPYAILHDLGEIGNCKTIILPGTMCMSKVEIDALAGFVNSGGGLVLTGNAGDFDEEYRAWMDQSLKARLGIAEKCRGGMVSVGGGLWPVVVEKGGYAAAGVGKGRVAAFPRMSSKNDFNTYDWTPNAFEQSQIWVRHKSWEAPRDMRRIADAIRWTLDYDLPVVVKAPEPVVCELTETAGAKYLHLLNYDADNPAKAVIATFRDKINSAELISPFTGEASELIVTGGNSVVIDSFDIYAIVKVE